MKKKELPTIDQLSVIRSRDFVSIDELSLLTNIPSYRLTEIAQKCRDSEPLEFLRDLQKVRLSKAYELLGLPFDSPWNNAVSITGSQTLQHGPSSSVSHKESGLVNLTPKN